MLKSGYAHTNYISIPGEFSTRGSIIDIFPKGFALPIRIVLDDEKIDCIKIFNPITQQSIEEISEITLNLGDEIEEDRTLLKERIINDLYAVSKKSALLEDFLIIEKDDYIVHINYGVGKFKGFKISRVSGKEVELISIEYNGGTLYVPVTHLHLIFRYQPDGNIKLARLTRKNWLNANINITKGINTFAINILSNLAKRRKIEGFKYIRNDDLEIEFEKSFKYTETPDQLKTINFFLEKLSKGEIIDGLICGDSGFGKTEVAARISFRIVCNGKQVAIVAPTTLLVEQHYMTFKERFRNFPVCIEKVSRYNSLSEIKSIVEKVAEGSIDIIIGTTTLLRNKFSFKDLGLFIIDEEHKFGVEDKEKLKFFNEKLNVLYLSSTPIPRTLYMSLQGLKDISYIKTPPEQRVGVTTKIIKFNKELIREIIKSEINRNGQVFFITDRIMNLDKIYKFLKDSFYHENIGIVHGQMPNKKLEDIFLKFYFGEYRILLSTNIVESGLDIVTANTIIIHNAHNFGLADLHQMRGRVGRGNQPGYAYLVIPDDNVIDSGVHRRLKILEEYSFLGSGFSISMFDMRVRGVGNVLGKQQHGFMKRLGIELYSHLLDLAVKKFNGEKIYEPDIELPFYFHIDRKILPDEKMRFYFYKKFSDANSQEEIENLRLQLEDFCGKLNMETEEFIFYHKLKILMQTKNIYKLERDGNDIIVRSFNRKDIFLPMKNFQTPSSIYQFILKNIV